MLVDLTRLQNYAWEVCLIWCIWVALSLECKCTAIEYRLAIFVVERPLEEVAAVELQCDLVGPNLHTATALWRVYVGNLDYFAIILSVDYKIVVVTAAHFKLWVAVVHALADSVRLAEIERCTLNLHRLAGWDERTVNRSDCLTIDCQDVVKNCAFAIALEVEE